MERGVSVKYECPECACGVVSRKSGKKTPAGYTLQEQGERIAMCSTRQDALGISDNKFQPTAKCWGPPSVLWVHEEVPV